MSSFAAPKEDIRSPPSPNDRSGSHSPVAPPYSPITPVLSTTTLNSTSAIYPYGPTRSAVEYPPPVPISENTNTDVIALRASLSVLQIQRLRAIQDLQTLKKQKAAAITDPGAYVQAIKSEKVKTTSDLSILGQPLNLEPLNDHDKDNSDYDDDGDGDNNDDVSVTKESETGQTEQLDSQFWEFPRAQNVVRCPPVNWAKYYVAGEPFENMHEDQRRRPTAGDSHGDDSARRNHVILAPYSPWKDKLLESSMKTRSESRRGA